MKNRLKNFLATLILSVVICTPLSAATNAKSQQPQDSEIVSEISAKMDFNSISTKIEEIEKTLKNEDFSQAKIDEYTAFLTEQENKIVENKKELEKQIKFVQKQLEALGEEPKEGEFEDSKITETRANLSKEMTSQDRILKEADLMIVKIEDLTAQVLNARNKKVYGDLITKQSALINPMVFFNGIKLYVIFFWDVVKSPIVWYTGIPESQRNFAVLSVVSMALILIVALTLAIFLRKYILSNWGYKNDIEQPRFSRKVVAAIAVATARGLIPAFLIGGCILWMVSTQIFSNTLLGSVFTVTAYVSLIAIVEATISRVTFAPHYEQWRLVNLPNKKAAKFTRMLFLFITINAVCVAQVFIAQEAGYSTDTLHFLQVIACAVKSFFLAWFAKISFETYKDIEVEKKEEPEAENDEDDDFKINNGFKIILFSNLFCVVVFALSLCGYPELASFILNRIIFSMIICGAFEVFRRAFSDAVKRIILAGPWMNTIRINKKVITKIEFWVKALLNPIMVLVLLFALLNLWGLPADFMLQTAKKLLFGFRIGGIQISLIAITMGIVVFFASITLVRILKKHLAKNVLEKIDMDDGIKHSLISGVGFIGFIISTLLAIIAIGVDLTNLAFIAGALSVGIGFGLQDVIKNLVAGIIILFERPFKVGDWVILNGTEGKIQQINIRSTEMESFNRTSVIVPNATLISSSVTNLTHGDNISRQSVKVGVAYGSDVEKVRQILLDVAAKHKFVMKNPAPYVLFQDFADSSLLFELRCYTNDIWKGWTIPSDLRFEINRRFIAEGIEIPFPQVVVHNGDKEEKTN
jgi:small-conductance mechanosensitive channel